MQLAGLWRLYVTQTPEFNMYVKTAAVALATVLAVASTTVPASAQHWHHHGGGIGAGIAGFAAGALIGGALAAQPAPYYYGPGYAYGGPGYAYGGAGYVYGAAGPGDAIAYCQSRYRSYDPASGTYLGNDGRRHPCP